MAKPPMVNMGPTDDEARRRRRRDCLVVSLAVGVIGVTFGVFAEAAGFDLPRIVVMSALVFTGASQFAAVGVIDDGGTGGAAVGSALLLATRNALYGPVVRKNLPDSVLPRLGAAHFVIDETTAMAVAQPDRRAGWDAFWFTGVTLWICWNLGSLAGAALGSVLSTPETWGLDAAFPCDLRSVARHSCPHRGWACGGGYRSRHRSGGCAVQCFGRSDPVGRVCGVTGVVCASPVAER